MTFDDVINDITKLIGLELQSIRPGAAITILEIDKEKNCLILKTSQGQTRSRPLSELQLIWNELIKTPAVHVEGVLHGSGTSRNQPETIFANLPYIEWLKINNKKHIAFVGKSSHPFGTLRQMNPLEAASITQNSENGFDSSKTNLVIVTNDILNTMSILRMVFPGTISTIEKGVYTFECPVFEMLILNSSKVNLNPGCYPVIPKTQTTATEIIEICDEEYYVISKDEIRILMRK